MHTTLIKVVRSRVFHSIQDRLERTLATESARAPREIPGPKPLPLVGTTLKHRPGGELYAKNGLEVDLRLYKKYGPLVRERMFPGYVMTHVYHPDDIEKVFRNEGKYPWRIPTDFTVIYRRRKGICPGLAHVQGEEWHHLRTGLQKYMLRPRAVAAYIPAQELVAEDLVKRVRLLRDANCEMENFTNELNKWSMESIGVVCFNRRVGALSPDLRTSPEADEFTRAVSGTFFHTVKLFNSLPLYKIFPSRNYREFTKCMDTIWRISKSHIDKSLERAHEGDLGRIGKEENLLLTLLDDPNLRRDEVLVTINDLFFAGVETTAHALSFALFHIASNPHAQQRLQEEVDSQLPRGVAMTETAFSGLSYLKAVVKETHRLTPVISGTIRKLENDIVLQGYRVPSGDMLMLQSGVACRLPQYYDEPDKFLPERWLRNTKAKDSHNAHPFTVLPFGFGPRMCVGRRFAEQEMYIAIAKLLQEFRLEYNREPLGMTTRVVNVPDGPLRLTLKDRG